MSERALADVTNRIVHCRLCTRLVEWREAVAANPPKRHAGEEYWARPVPGFGDPEASVLIVGLAPAAHGGNRTGRVFTGDRSGDFLFASLHRVGMASQPQSERADDGLTLHEVYVAAVNRCAPPGNRPTPEERDNCLPYLAEELAALGSVRTIVCLGAYAWDGAVRAIRSLGHDVPTPRPRFGHGAESDAGPYRLLGCYHPSQQNTFTGVLTPEMLDKVFVRAKGSAA